MSQIQHPLIRPGALEARQYQLAIAMRALEGNTMVVLPTGLGKTAIALLVAASRLREPGSRVLVLAPTKPLAEQHYRYFSNLLQLPEEDPFVLFTGETPPAERVRGWQRARVCFATPQVIKNDCLAGRYSLEDVSLLVVDECHRAVGNYAYTFLAGWYAKTAARPLLLAMTASPGGDHEKLLGICSTLGITQVETRTEADPDVAPYVHERTVEYLRVELPPELVEARNRLFSLLDSRLEALHRLGFTVPDRARLSMRALNQLNAEIQERIANRDASAFQAASVHAELLKIRHGITLCESQGSVALTRFLERLAGEGASASGSKASQRLSGDPVFIELVTAARAWEGELHPKYPLVRSVVEKQLRADPASRIIVFASYRDTVQALGRYLSAAGIGAERFVGQASRDSERGQSQRQQLDTLRRFRAGEFRVLIATSVGEEGLDIPSTDLVVFYEAVPSEIRSIQRKGRTGRSGEGRIVVLLTAGTSDETFRYVSQSRERSMQRGLARLRTPPGADGQTRLPSEPMPDEDLVQQRLAEFFPDGPRIVADDRETSSRVVEVLRLAGAALEIAHLETGDYAIGDRVLIERKTTRDFVDTLVDRDLFGQLGALAGAVPRPVLVIEGADLYGQRNIHPNAIRGALAAIAVEMGISLFYTADEDETAQLLLVLARREEGEPGERKVHPGKTRRSVREQQEYLISCLPDVGPRTARMLLDAFGSVLGVLTADREALQAVPGIGKRTAERIVTFVREGS
ncbi:MAG TPA: DEAD/DEAH box helicase [Methanoregulaceae archaeon]|nr:DEAD/DEAH box helicase [Methanoregulaceae archaeon]